MTEEHKQRVVENKALRRIFGPKRDEVTEEWRRLHKEELFGLYSSPNIIWVVRSRRMRQKWNLACTGESRGAYKVLGFGGES